MTRPTAPGIVRTWCNPYGAETGGAKRFLGDTDAAKGVFHQWHCENPAEVRCRMQCEHGHVGQVMNLCRQHFTAFKMRDMTFCPTCNRSNDHKCLLSLTEIS